MPARKYTGPDKRKKQAKPVKIVDGVPHYMRTEKRTVAGWATGSKTKRVVRPAQRIGDPKKNKSD